MNSRPRFSVGILTASAIILSIAATGCDEYVEAGDFLTPSVQPMDFSPYGYDYDMYDIFTEDI